MSKPSPAEVGPCPDSLQPNPFADDISCQDPVVVRLYPFDPLRLDSSARISYSENTQPLNGTTKRHPIRTPEDSLLLQPGIGPALDAVYVETHPGAKEDPGHLSAAYPESFNFGVALSGLRRLRRTLKDDRNAKLRLDIIATKPVVESLQLAQTAHEQEVQRRAKIAEEQAAFAQAEAASREAAQTTKRLEREQHQAQQTEFRQQFREAVETVRELAPDANLDGLIGIVNKLVIYRRPDGLAVTAGTNLEPKLLQRMKEYLENPQQLLDTYKAAALLETSDLSADQAETVGTYFNGLFALHEGAFSKSFYGLDDFSSQMIARWTALRTSLPPTMTLEEFRQHWYNEDDVDVLAYQQAAGRNGQILLANSLQAIAKNHPREFIDKVYMLAETGLVPGDQILCSQTLSWIRLCLKDEPRARLILDLAKIAQPKEVRQKALDLDQVFYRFGFPRQLLRHTREQKDSLSRKQQRAIQGRFYPHVRPGDLGIDPSSQAEARDKVREALDEEITEFHAHARTTPEGKANTIYGRLEQHFSAANKEEQSPDSAVDN